jgi:hypothetical protein
MITVRGFLAFFYVSLLVVQFGLQPFLTREYISFNSIKSSIVIIVELLKFTICLIVLCSSAKGQETLLNWKFSESLKLAGLPALSYAIQNLCVHTAYQHLDGTMYFSYSNLLHSKRVKIKLHSKRVKIKLHSKRVKTKLRSERVKIKLHSERVNIKLHSERVNIKLHSKRVKTKLHSERVKIKLHSERVKIRLRSERVKIKLRSERV